VPCTRIGVEIAVIRSIATPNAPVANREMGTGNRPSLPISQKFEDYLPASSALSRNRVERSGNLNRFVVRILAGSMRSRPEPVHQTEDKRDDENDEVAQVYPRDESSREN
jgi:hypothetical protein